jgi:hypothetical protein
MLLCTHGSFSMQFEASLPIKTLLCAHGTSLFISIICACAIDNSERLPIMYLVSFSYYKYMNHTHSANFSMHHLIFCHLLWISL